MVRVTESDFTLPDDRYVSSNEAHTYFDVRGIQCQDVYDTELKRRVTKVGPCAPVIVDILTKLSQRAQISSRQSSLLIGFLQVHDVVDEPEGRYFITETIPVATAESHWSALTPEQQQILQNTLGGISMMRQRNQEYHDFLASISRLDHVHLGTDARGNIHRAIIVPF